MKWYGIKKDGKWLVGGVWQDSPAYPYSQFKTAQDLAFANNGEVVRHRNPVPSTPHAEGFETNHLEQGAGYYY